jgi:hypothetical protein
VNVRQPLRIRAVVVMIASTALLLAACGGGGSDKPSTAPSTNGGSNTSTTASSDGGGNGKCYTTPGSQTAKVRFVNLYTNDTYPQSDIDVYEGFGAKDACGEKLATVPYGEASDYIEVHALDESGNWSVTSYVAGSSDDDHQIINQSETWKGGEQVTIVYAAGDPDFGTTEANGSDQAFFENDPEEGSSSIKAVPGKAVVAIAAQSLQYIVPDDAWKAGVAGTAGCLLGPDDTENSSTNIGGTSLLEYPVAPGSLELALYKVNPTASINCTGTPAIGPVTFDAADGSRTLVLAYGPDAQTLKLLVLPVDD